MGGASANMQKKDGLSWKQTFFSGSVKKHGASFFSDVYRNRGEKVLSIRRFA